MSSSVEAPKPVYVVPVVVQSGGVDAGPQPADREEEHARHDEERREQEVPPLALDEVKEHQSAGGSDWKQ